MALFMILRHAIYKKILLFYRIMPIYRYICTCKHIISRFIISFSCFEKEKKRKKELFVSVTDCFLVFTPSPSLSFTKEKKEKAKTHKPFHRTKRHTALCFCIAFQASFLYIFMTEKY
jgi:hypothetical protein